MMSSWGSSVCGKTRQISGTMTRITNRLSAILVTAIKNGRIENAIVRTTMFSVGDAIIADSVVSARNPAEYMPLAMGAAQFTQTPSGAPITMPRNELAKPPLKLRRRR